MVAMVVEVAAILWYHKSQQHYGNCVMELAVAVFLFREGNDVRDSGSGSSDSSRSSGISSEGNNDNE